MMLDPNQKLESFLPVQTKLYRPQPNTSIIQRPHLLARLDRGLRHKLILVSAPPGFGKTTLVSQWLAGDDLPAAWLSLDENDNHLPQFLRYVCAAIRRCVPEACATLQDLLTHVNLLNVDYLADLLVEELNALPTELILVLDDYHCIRASEVHQVMRHLLRYLPPRLHLVILTRSDPPLLLGRLRIGRQITEIRAADLRFGLAETGLFLREQTGQPLDEALIQSLQARTEGWIIGLQLAGISLHNQSPDQFLAHFSGSHRLLAGYLVEEVMAGLPKAVAEFLTRTAVVDRFCAPLGDALLAGSPWPDSSQATIAQLEAQNIFIIPLDDEGTWYRYHDLFRDFLLHRLKQDQTGLARLHQCAAEWLAQAGLIEDALRHTLAAGDETRAADLVETNLHPLLNQQVPPPVLTRWLDLFPERLIQTQPGLLIAQLHLFAFRWDLVALGAVIDRATSLMQASSDTNGERQRLRLAMLNWLRGFLSYWQGEARRAIPLLEDCLDCLQDPVAYSFTRAQAINILSLAYAGCGQRETALALLRTALAEAIAHHRPGLVAFLGSRMVIHWYAGELAEAAHAAEHLLATADSWQTHPAWSGAGIVQLWRGWAHYLLGTIRYEQNDLEAAAQHWRQVEAMRYRVNPGAFLGSLTGLAFIAQAQGEVVQALAYAQTAHEFALELRSPLLLELSEALEVRLALLGGNQAKALRHSQEINTTANQGNSVWLEPPRLAAVRALLAAATPASLATALQLAETCLHQAENVHNTHQAIQVAALQALIWHALRRTTKAFETLDRALALAEPGNFVRTFLDLGAPMVELLQQFDHQRGPSPYIKRLLAAFTRELDPAGHRKLMAQYLQLSNITPLTQRELELLALVSQRLTIDEMAQRLVISPNTVKKHVYNIYTKLGVNNRRQAIARAKEVGLLPPA